jgi:hypothetical protein
MADLPRNPDTGDEGDVEPDRSSTSGTPRWVKVFGIIVIILVLLVIIMMSIGGGSHGPGRHTPFGDTGGQTPLSSVIEDYTPPGRKLGGHAPLEGGH